MPSLIGPVFMLMVAKVRKNGPFLLTSLVTGVVLVAATWMFPIHRAGGRTFV